MRSTALTRRQSAREQFVDACSHRRKAKDGVTILTPDKRVRTLAEYQIRGARFNPTQLIVDSGISEKDWMQLGRGISHVSSASKWWIADWLIYGDKIYGRRTTYDLAVQSTGKDREQLHAIKYVGSKFEPARRRAELSFQHHHEAASLPPSDADELLQMAVDLGLTCHQLAEMVNKRRAKKPNAEWHTVPVPMKGEIYDTLLALAGSGKHFGHFVAGIVREWLEEHGHLQTQSAADKARRAKWVAEGLCSGCGKIAPRPGKLCCENCIRHAADWKRWNREERQEP